ncbi:hypothetical protein CR205_13735 [Alteribacter lacisalsi]|uniref:Uncharacterized protein n=1 Tax=Alteribacter lacisalsi TaxID=2045244 RepID=A0A2W0HH42_9BACI|nr:hypothetical protein CR205_13735 [Alteribacter lacisalsi]
MHGETIQQELLKLKKTFFKKAVLMSVVDFRSQSSFSAGTTAASSGEIALRGLHMVLLPLRVKLRSWMCRSRSQLIHEGNALCCSRRSGARSLR